jgi:uncharacterized damage-inducible protein DinB
VAAEEGLSTNIPKLKWENPEGYSGQIDGVTAVQAAWEPAPGRKTIWQLTLHIAYWKYAVRHRFEGGRGGRFPRHPANWPQLPRPASDAAWAADVALLRTEHDLLLEVIAGIPMRRYPMVVPGGRRWTVGELIVGIAQHDAYHVGQIQMLKRLWEARSGG